MPKGWEETQEFIKRTWENSDEEKKDMTSSQLRSKFLNCANQLVIRKDDFNSAYEHPTDYSKVRIRYSSSVSIEMMTIDIDVPNGNTKEVIWNIYEQLSE